MSAEMTLNDFLTKVGAKDLNSAYQQFTQLKKVEEDYGPYIETEEDREFWKQYQSVKSTRRGKFGVINKKMELLADRIATKLDMEVRYIEENDGMYFLDFSNGHLANIHGHPEWDNSTLTEKDLRCVTAEFEEFCRLDDEYSQLIHSSSSDSDES